MSARANRGARAGSALAAPGGEVTLTLSSAQVQSLIEQATAPLALAEAVTSVVPEVVGSLLRPLLKDTACSQTIVRALIILASFPPDGSERELTAVAAEAGLAPGTTHRYLHTLTAAGLLRRDNVSRRYHRPRLSYATNSKSVSKAHGVAARD